MTTPEQLRELSEKASRGPWAWLPVDGQFIADFRGNTVGEIPCQGCNPTDGAFIVACVNYVRAALAAPERAPRADLYEWLESQRIKLDERQMWAVQTFLVMNYLPVGQESDEAQPTTAKEEEVGGGIPVSRLSGTTADGGIFTLAQPAKEKQEEPAADCGITGCLLPKGHSEEHLDPPEQPREVPQCQHCEALWERNNVTMMHRMPGTTGDNYPCTAADAPSRSETSAPSTLADKIVAAEREWLDEQPATPAGTQNFITAILPLLAEAVKQLRTPASAAEAGKFADLDDELRQCLQIIVTNAGNLEGGIETVCIEKAVMRAANALGKYAAGQAARSQVEAGTFACPICCNDKPHYHTERERRDWISAQAERFGIRTSCPTAGEWLADLLEDFSEVFQQQWGSLDRETQIRIEELLSEHVERENARVAAGQASQPALSEEQANAVMVQIARLCSYGCACDLRNGYVCGIHKLSDEVKTNVLNTLRQPASAEGK